MTRPIIKAALIGAIGLALMILSSVSVFAKGEACDLQVLDFIIGIEDTHLIDDKGGASLMTFSIGHGSVIGASVNEGCKIPIRSCLLARCTSNIDRINTDESGTRYDASRENNKATCPSGLNAHDLPELSRASNRIAGIVQHISHCIGMNIACRRVASIFQYKPQIYNDSPFIKFETDDLGINRYPGPMFRGEVLIGGAPQFVSGSPERECEPGYGERGNDLEKSAMSVNKPQAAYSLRFDSDEDELGFIFGIAMSLLGGCLAYAGTKRLCDKIFRPNEQDQNDK